ncbi:cupin domain-containing protein [Brevibacillus sp. B_LB10_24]|uniref:cupin domain-containing protein n=1 Tax=Brevibacillus sp. B_LB10_24 TaxID=3380645 RepID=UPI0038BBF61A
MYKVHESESEYRFGDHGPKYLMRGSQIEFGIVVLKPGQEFQNHYHEHYEENFFVLEGKVDFYVDGSLHTLEKGDLLRCDKREAHYLINPYDADFKAVFVKAPHVTERDYVEVENPAIQRSGGK